MFDSGTKTLYVFAVTEGPHLQPKKGGVALVVLYHEGDSETHCTDMYFSDFETAYKFRNEVETSPNPVKVSVDKNVEIEEDLEWRKRLH